LNIDYKIATEAIENRQKKIIKNNIPKSNRLPIRQVYSCKYKAYTRRTFKNTNKPGLLFFVDFEKEFDSVDHFFVIKPKTF